MQESQQSIPCITTIYSKSIPCNKPNFRKKIPWTIPNIPEKTPTRAAPIYITSQLKRPRSPRPRNECKMVNEGFNKFGNQVKVGY